MINSIDMGVHCNAVRTELRHYAGLNVQDCFWTHADGYRRGDFVPIIIPAGAHPMCVRGRWAPDGDGTVNTSGSQRALLPASAARFSVKSGFATWAWDSYALSPANRDWFAIGCTYHVAADGQVTFKIVTNAAEGERAAVVSREPLIVPPQAWDTWLTPGRDAGLYPPRPGSLRLDALVKH